jgi:radical SAM protein with 4Fe4S-binding SPASM domain
MAQVVPAAVPVLDGILSASPLEARPHVVAWNLTRRCNLACAHCYIAAGSWHDAATELTTAEVQRIMDEILAVNAAPLFILSGGEPLLRDDLEQIAAHATRGGATVVVGTNGTRLTDARITSLQEAGVSGVAISIDSLDAHYHDRFRHGDGALADTLAAVDRLGRHRLDFIVQTTVTHGNRAQLRQLAAWAAQHRAVAFNVYFLVETGRGEGMHGLSPTENDAVLAELIDLENEYRGRMMVRSKCQPQIMRHALAADTDSPLRNYATRCPCGVQYCRITPEGKLTPCPYLPEVAGDLRVQSFSEVWNDSPLLQALREREPGGKCGKCEYRRVCGGCRARAFARTGDVLGEDDSCAYEPSGVLPLVEAGAHISYGAAATAEMQWDAEARARISRVPSFVRGVVVSRIEAFARERGHDRVTLELMAEVRRSMPIDFSRRRPFFLEDDA